MPLLFPLLFVAARAAFPVGTLAIRSQGYFYVGGQYDNPANPTYMSGQMYVRYQIPVRTSGAPTTRYPVVMIHGAGQQATTYTGTPDDRSGWADYFLNSGWPVYTVDQPGRGKSIYLERAYGPRGTSDIANLENLFTAPARMRPYPQARLHTVAGTGDAWRPGLRPVLRLAVRNSLAIAASLEKWLRTTL